MKKIGEGWDYNVYSVSDTRIKKNRKTKPQLLWLLLRTANIVPLFRAMFTDYVWSSITPSCQFVQSFIGEHPDLTWFFGNPTFGENDSYAQDKVIPVKSYLKTATFEDKKKVLDQYADAVRFMWRHHFSDTSFKFSKNYGIDKQGRLILIDFSNLTQDRKVIEDLLNQNFLLKVWVYRKMVDSRLKETYREIIAKKLTVQVLFSVWN